MAAETFSFIQFFCRSCAQFVTFIISQPPTALSPPSLLLLLGRFLFYFFFRLASSSTAAAAASRPLRGEPTVGIVSEAQTIFTAALSGLPGNKGGIDPPNEPTQQSLLLDLYLLKSGQEKSGTFSTFLCICRLIDCPTRSRAGLLECLGSENIRK